MSKSIIDITFTKNNDLEPGLTNFSDSIYEQKSFEKTFKEESYGTKRELKARHVQFIALGGAIGTGLFVASGSALATCGPLAILVAYLIMCFLVYFVMNQIAEMITYLPEPGKCTIYYLCQRYTGNRSLAFAVGLNIFYAQVVTAAAEITATAFIIQYWSDLNIAIWISIFYVLIVAINFLGVKHFGEVEFWIASLKIFCIIGLIITGLVIFFGGAPASHGILGFHYWRDPGAIKKHLVDNKIGFFLSVWTAIVKSSFAYILSPELITCCAAEAENPRKNLPRATDRFIYRLLTFYVLGILVIGVIVAYNDPRLMSAIESGSHNAQASPFVIGIQNAGIKVLNHIVNGCILSSAFSAGNSFVFSSSRSLYSMSKNGDLPRCFAKCNKYGVPYYSVLLSCVICLISYLNVSNSASAVFLWFGNISTVSGFINWIVASVTYLRYRKAMKFHAMDSKVTYRPYLQMTGTYITVVAFSLLTLTNGYAVFFNFNIADFLAAYITIPIFITLYLGHMMYTRNFKIFSKPEDIDVISGLEETEREARNFTETQPKNFIHKLWLWLC